MQQVRWLEVSIGAEAWAEVGGGWRLAAARALPTHAACSPACLPACARLPAHPLVPRSLLHMVGRQGEVEMSAEQQAWAVRARSPAAAAATMQADGQ